MHALLTGIVALEGFGALHRFRAREVLYREASARALALRRPLVVVGAPRAGFHTKLVPAYGCGDICVDLEGCECPISIQADLTKGPVPQIPSDSGVVFCSCVLEYTTDPYAAWSELLRIAGSSDRVYLVTVEPWTLTSVLYPEARWTIVRKGAEIQAEPISFWRKAAYATAVGALVTSAVT